MKIWTGDCTAFLDGGQRRCVSAKKLAKSEKEEKRNSKAADSRAQTLSRQKSRSKDRPLQAAQIHLDNQ
jgi:hypothetical protein